MGAENGCGVHPGGFVSWTGTIIERSANRTIWFRAEGSTAGGLSPLDARLSQGCSASLNQMFNPLSPPNIGCTALCPVVAPQYCTGRNPLLPVSHGSSHFRSRTLSNPPSSFRISLHFYLFCTAQDSCTSRTARKFEQVLSL